MAQFRKKPVVIEAWRFTSPPDWTGPVDPQWITDAILHGEHVGGLSLRSNPTRLLVFTLEGVMEARPGDWIIKGVQGELYSCKPDIFEATYEAVS